MVVNDSHITATEVCEMLSKPRLEYADRAIHLVLDNARYQKCRAVQEMASNLGIHLEYIPPYSPNLNLIERLWKFVKEGLLTKYYDDFSLFCEKIGSILDSTTQTNKAKVEKLMSEKVQLFDGLSPITDNTLSNVSHCRLIAA